MKLQWSFSLLFGKNHLCLVEKWLSALGFTLGTFQRLPPHCLNSVSVICKHSDFFHECHHSCPFVCVSPSSVQRGTSPGFNGSCLCLGEVSVCTSAPVTLRWTRKSASWTICTKTDTEIVLMSLLIKGLWFGIKSCSYDKITFHCNELMTG